MAAILLASAGAAIGGGIGGSIFGVSAATIGGAVGSFVGSAVDSMIVSALAPAQRIEGQRLETLQVTTSTEGAVLTRIFGRMRLGGNIIWATDFTETVNTTTQGGGKGGGPKVTTTTYVYSASVAVALCEGEITGIGRIWADGKPLDATGLTWRFYKGDETQSPDPFIEAKMGAGLAPAYRGTAYVVFEELPLEAFGNRIPQLSFEVFAPVAETDTVEGQLRAVTLIPGSGEFVHATEPISAGSSGTSSSENVHSTTGETDIVAALDQLQAALPNIESVSLVVSWFGTDLRAGNCQIKPGVEIATKITTPQVWIVNGINRASAYLILPDSSGNPAYGGTPADFAVVDAIQELKARGLRVTFYPFILMDVPVANTLPNPYSDNAATVGQAAYPWRGRITCSPAAGYVGTVDKTASATAQITAFFGTAATGDFSVSGEAVSWTGGVDWGYRRMILHYAHLCAAAGGADTFLIGSELVGLTEVRDSATTYPAVPLLQQLAADVSGILGGSVSIGYAADWSEYFGHQPSDGSGDVFFHLDPLWSDVNIDFIGIDNYLPLSDWRDGTGHLDAIAGWPNVHDRAYLQSNIEGGERYDWYYASDAARAAQTRTTISDGAYAKPWVFRPKDLRNWWLNQHFDRPGGVESATPTAWAPQSKPIRFTEFGCPAVDRGTNQPNVFFDPKSSESAVPHYSRGWRDDAIQRAYHEAMLGYWGDAANNPTSSVYSAPMIDMGEMAAWTWDARPYPDFPGRTDIWADAGNWQLGHWLAGRVGSAGLAALVRALCRRTGLDDALMDVSDLVGSAPGFAVSALESPRASIAVLARHFGFDAAETGGLIKFVPRGRASVATIAPDDMVAGGSGSGEVMELVRGQETELPQALKWQVVRPDEEYDTATAEARRVTVTAARVASETFPLAVPLEEADRRARRALMEAWVGRETLTAGLPPSRMALDTGDVIALNNDGRLVEYRLVEYRLARIADAGARAIEAMRADAAMYDLPPGQASGANLPGAVVYGPAEVALMDLPTLNDTTPAHRPWAAVFARPWYGAAAIWRSVTTSGFTLLDTALQPAHMGTLVADLPAGPVGRWDLANTLSIDLTSGALASVSDLDLFAGANTFAIETATGQWEIVQAGTATLVASGRYDLTRLLRGQRGTADWMGAPALAGARVVLLDSALQPLSIAEADIGIAWNWRIGPSNAQPSDAIMQAPAFTPAARGLKPFAPVHPRLRKEATGDLTLTWLRSDRAFSADAWEPVDVPMSESAESYDLEIMSGSVVVRTIAGLSAPSFTYTVAMQTADFGGAVTSLAVQIYQNGAYGRGTRLAETVTVSQVAP